MVPKNWPKLNKLSYKLLLVTLQIFFLFAILSKQSLAKSSGVFNYFASLRASETNVRSGPGRIYPIKFTYKIKNIPILITDEYDNWNEIRDYEGQTGWISKSLITKKRSLMIRTSKSYALMHSSRSRDSRTILKLENNVIGDYVKCLDNWCKIEVANKSGWVEKVDLFGF